MHSSSKTNKRHVDMPSERMKRSVTDQHSITWPSFLRWPVFLIANAAILLFVGVSTLRETYTGWSVDREIQSLQSQADMLEGRKLKLTEFADSLSSPEQVELDARRRLGWKKDGEQVVVLSGYQASGTLSGESDDVSVLPEPVPLSNVQRWWMYFFSHLNS